MPIHITRDLLAAGLMAYSSLAAAHPAGHAQHHAPQAVSAPAVASSAPAGAVLPGRPAGPHAYRSAFDGYRRHAEQPVQSWREANDNVGRIGGWQAYAREAQAASSAPPASPAAPAAPSSGAPAGGHTGHR